MVEMGFLVEKTCPGHTGDFNVDALIGGVALETEATDLRQDRGRRNVCSSLGDFIIHVFEEPGMMLMGLYFVTGKVPGPKTRESW